MEKLIEKHPALGVPYLYTEYVKTLRQGDSLKAKHYKYFKLNISCIGLDPSEYEQCIKWFCDTMEY